MIEIEFSALARQCLNRRIPTIEQLESEILALISERNVKQIKIDWQFSIQGRYTEYRERLKLIEKCTQPSQVGL